MSMTNAQRTELISTINGEDVRISTVGNGLLDVLDLKGFIPPAVDGVLHSHCSTFFFPGQTITARAGGSLTSWIDNGDGDRLYAICMSSNAVDRGPY